MAIHSLPADRNDQNLAAFPVHNHRRITESAVSRPGHAGTFYQDKRFAPAVFIRYTAVDVHSAESYVQLAVTVVRQRKESSVRKRCNGGDTVWDRIGFSVTEEHGIFIDDFRAVARDGSRNDCHHHNKFPHFTNAYEYPSTLSQSPLVKSGTSTGMLPFSRDILERSLTQHHSAMS